MTSQKPQIKRPQITIPNHKSQPKSQIKNEIVDTKLVNVGYDENEIVGTMVLPMLPIWAQNESCIRSPKHVSNVVS